MRKDANVSRTKLAPTFALNFLNAKLNPRVNMHMTPGKALEVSVP